METPRFSTPTGPPTNSPRPESAQEWATEFSAQARERLQATRDRVRAEIEARPGQSLVIAAAIGATLGWMIKRM